jgi:hypothetical protein
MTITNDVGRSEGEGRFLGTVQKFLESILSSYLVERFLFQRGTWRG